MTAFLAHHGVWAVFVLMAVDAVFPAASELVMLYGGALASGALTHERHESWLKLQRELRAIAVRSDARLRREEKRKWQQRAREGRSRARHRG